MSQNIVVPNPAQPGTTITFAQTYTYDQVNRLLTAMEGANAWTQTYDYDIFGNRAVRAGSTILNPQMTPTSPSAGDLSAFNANTNRIALSGFGYDLSGNRTSLQYPNGQTITMQYDGNGDHERGRAR